MSEKIDVAIIGAGRMGQIHGPNAARHPDLRLRYVVETNAALGNALAKQTGAEIATLNDVLGDPAIKGVVIASSTDMHLEHSLAVIGAGKAALCVPGFNRRFDPHVTALREKIASGAIGDLETLTLINHDPAAPPPAFIPRSGGLFKDFTIHDLDLAYCLLGEPPVEIFATASC